jgi:hypothetical protein
MERDRMEKFDQLDLNNMDFADHEQYPLMLSSFSAENSPTRGLQTAAPSPPDSKSEMKRPASAVRRRSPLPHPYAYQHQMSAASRDHFGRSPREPYPNTPMGQQGLPPSGYRPVGYAQASPGVGYNRGPRSSPAGYGFPRFPPPRQGFWMSPYPDFDSFPEMADHIPPPPSDDHNHSTQGTPEKLRSRSPFRSPLSSIKKFKRSPESSPHFGPSNSWGMDTPGGTFANDFSPMGTTLNELDETSNFDIELSRSNSQDSPGLIHRVKLADQSPMNALMYSPYEGPLGGIAQSPMIHGRTEAPGHEQLNPVTASGARAEVSSIRGSTPSSVRKALWRPNSPPSGTRGSLRLEIGGAGSLSTSKALEGINTRLQSVPSSTRHDSYGRSHVMPNSAGQHMHAEIATPIKSSGYPSPRILGPPASFHRYLLRRQHQSQSTDLQLLLARVPEGRKTTTTLPSPRLPSEFHATARRRVVSSYTASVMLLAYSVRIVIARTASTTRPTKRWLRKRCAKLKPKTEMPLLSSSVATKRNKILRRSIALGVDVKSLSASRSTARYGLYVCELISILGSDGSSFSDLFCFPTP